jgi:hypothetical protein
MRAPCSPHLITLTELDKEYKQAHYNYDVEMAFKLTAHLSQEKNVKLQWVMFS